MIFCDSVDSLSNFVHNSLSATSRQLKIAFSDVWALAKKTLLRNDFMSFWNSIKMHRNTLLIVIILSQNTIKSFIDGTSIFIFLDNDRWILYLAMGKFCLRSNICVLSIFSSFFFPRIRTHQNKPIRWIWSNSKQQQKYTNCFWL